MIVSKFLHKSIVGRVAFKESDIGRIDEFGNDLDIRS